METTPHTEADAIERIARLATEPSRFTEGDIPIVALADGLTLHSLERTNANPSRFQARVILTTLADHIAYIKAQRGGDVNGDQNTVLFADRNQLRFHTILDYHEQETPSWLDHSLTTTLALSKQLQTWITKAGAWMPQEQFAEFLDENLGDIQEPTPATVLDFVECLTCTRKEAFRSAMNQTTGEVQFVWEKTNATDERTSIVRDFTLGIPVWHRGDPFAIKARLQHRIKENEGGKAGVHFRFKLEQIDRIQDKLWDEAIALLRTELADHTTIYEGTAPSAPEPIRIG
jgi:uncharacterized protein YfdQ (DUF2303 family)